MIIGSHDYVTSRYKLRRLKEIEDMVAESVQIVSAAVRDTIPGTNGYFRTFHSTTLSLVCQSRNFSTRVINVYDRLQCIHSQGWHSRQGHSQVYVHPLCQRGHHCSVHVALDLQRPFNPVKTKANRCQPQARTKHSTQRTGVSSVISISRHG